MIDAPAFPAPLSSFIYREVEWGSLKRAQMEERFIKLADKVDEKETKAEDGIPTSKIGSARFQSPQTDISDNKKKTESLQYITFA